MSLPGISILGCGWLGLPLAVYLHEMAYKVKGTTTTETKLKLLLEKGINPYFLNLTPIVQARDIAGFLTNDILVINIPPGTRTRSAEFHIEQINHLSSHLEKSNVEKIIYVSSTSVYPDLSREVLESDVTDPSHSANKTLARAEQMIQQLPNKKVTILRLGGLTGYDRLLIRHFAGRKDLAIGHEPVNLIHRDDAVQIIESIIRQNKWGEVYNVCSPIHPLKKDFYIDLAKRFGYEKPEFKNFDPPPPFKIVNSEKLIRDLNYNYIYPDPKQYNYKIV